MTMSDQEYDYIWNVAETLDANHITMELPTDDTLLKRVAEYAAKRKLRIAFHTHGQGGDSGFDKALAASAYTALNLDVGHYYGVNGKSPVPVWLSIATALRVSTSKTARVRTARPRVRGRAAEGRICRGAKAKLRSRKSFRR